MNNIYEPIDHGTVAKTRESFSARLLTDPQFEEFASICGILHREIHRSGSFIEKLETYAFAVSRTEKGINAAKADTILRDIFKGLFGQSLDQLRKQLLKAEDELFYRAYAEQASLMAIELGVTDVFAKKLIAEQFKTAEAREFYEEGKQFEDKFYRPQIEAEKRKRETRNNNGRKRYSGYAADVVSQPAPKNG